MVLEDMSADGVRRRVRVDHANLIPSSLRPLKRHRVNVCSESSDKVCEVVDCDTTCGGGRDEVVASALTHVYDALTANIEVLISSRRASADKEMLRSLARETTRSIQVMSLLNKDLRTRTRMTTRVAACVFYQLRCQRPITMQTLPPYEDVPWALNLSTPLPETSVVHWDSVGSDAKSKAVAKIARAPPHHPELYYEQRRICSADAKNRETRLTMLPVIKCEGISWNDALETILSQERLPDLQSAPAEVHAYVSSSRARLQRDMQRTSKAKRCCVNRDCRRLYPCYEWRANRNDFYKQILFHIFPKIDRHYTRYWMELLCSHEKTSIGAPSFCSSICFEQCWVPRMRETLGCAHWVLNIDDIDSLEQHGSEHRVHAVLTRLIGRNQARHGDLKELIEREQRSSTCLRERDVKAITEMMIHVLNMDTTIVLLLSTLRANGNFTKDPCPRGWRAKLSTDELDQYVEAALLLLKLRLIKTATANTTLLFAISDLANMQRYCRQHIRANSGSFLKLNT